MKLAALEKKYGHILWTDKKRHLGMKISFTTYIVTESQIIRRSGLLSIHNSIVELYHVIDQRLDEPFGQRIFGCSTLTVVSNDTDTPSLKIAKIKHGYELLAVLNKAIPEAKVRMRTGGRDIFSSMDSWEGHAD